MHEKLNRILIDGRYGFSFLVQPIKFLNRLETTYLNLLALGLSNGLKGCRNEIGKGRGHGEIGLGRGHGETKLKRSW